MNRDTTFDAETWTRVLARDTAIDPNVLLDLRLRPPRIVFAEAVARGEARPSVWDEEDPRDIRVIATQLHVTPRTILGRCRRWGIPVIRTPVARGQRLRALTRAGYALFMARSLSEWSAPAGSARTTSHAS